MTDQILKIMLLISGTLGLSCIQAIKGQTPSIRLAFEVASVKLNTSGCPNGGGGRPVPGRLAVTCIAVRELIEAAYGMFANGSNRTDIRTPVVNAPGWIDSDRFDITATANDASIETMYGPMLQMLLEERFALKIHRAERELPVYVLTVGKSGPKLSPIKPGSCTPVDLSRTSIQSPKPPTNLCGRASYGMKGGNRIVDVWGITMAQFAGITLSRLNLGRRVVDRTGLSELFDIHLEFSGEGTAAANATDESRAGLGPSVFTAIQEQLGLRLSSDKAPVEVLVVDHIEKPSENY